MWYFVLAGWVGLSGIVGCCAVLGWVELYGGVVCGGFVLCAVGCWVVCWVFGHWFGPAGGAVLLWWVHVLLVTAVGIFVGLLQAVWCWVSGWGCFCVVAWVAWAVLRCVGEVGVVSWKGGVVGCVVCCFGLGCVR